MSLKEKIVHESLKLFSLKGFLSTSLNDILTAAGTSKGGFYNHFQSKEDLFFHVMDEAGKIWREKNLAGLDEIEKPVEKIKKLLENFKNRYLLDSENFPGGCVFITLSVELNDQRPHLSKEISKGFTGVKKMLKRLLDQGKSEGALARGVDTAKATEIFFAGLLGASVIYGADKSDSCLNSSIEALINYLESIKI